MKITKKQLENMIGKMGLTGNMPSGIKNIEPYTQDNELCYVVTDKKNKTHVFGPKKKTPDRE